MVTNPSSRILIRAAILLVGAEPDEVEKVIDHLQGKIVPETPEQVVADIQKALEEVRRGKQQ